MGSQMCKRRREVVKEAWTVLNGGEVLISQGHASGGVKQKIADTRRLLVTFVSDLNCCHISLMSGVGYLNEGIIADLRETVSDEERSDGEAIAF